MFQEPPITTDDLAAGDDKDEAAFFVGRKELIASIESTVAGIENKIKAYNNPEARVQAGKAIASQKT